MVSIKLFMPQRKKNQIVRNMMINIFPHNFKYYVSHYENKIKQKKLWKYGETFEIKNFLWSARDSASYDFPSNESQVSVFSYVYIWSGCTSLSSVRCQMYIWMHETCMYLFSIHIQSCHWNAISSKQLHGTQIISK